MSAVACLYLVLSPKYSVRGQICYFPPRFLPGGSTMSRAAYALISVVLPTFFWFIQATAAIDSPPSDGKLNIVVFGAHPDDAEYKAGGCGAKWAKQGHHVLLCSVTNGDIGHWQMAGGPLAARRTAEAAACSKVLGTTSKILDNHDGELE